MSREDGRSRQDKPGERGGLCLDTAFYFGAARALGIREVGELVRMLTGRLRGTRARGA
jgi:hypothetical protein